MSIKTLNLTDQLYQYLLATSLREPDVLKELREETAKLPQAIMQISPEQGQLMRLLIELMNAKKTIEVGVFTGYSSLSVALALPNDGELIACDVSDQFTKMARKFWEKAGVAHKIKLHLQPALKTLDELIQQKQHNTFDFAFIDADKQNYLNYYEKLLELIRPGGLIAVDNTLWDGDVAKPEVQDASTIAMRAFNQRVHHDERVSISLVPIGDGLTLLRKR